MSILTPIIGEVAPIVDVADAVAHGVTSLLDKLQAIVHGDMSQVGPAIAEAKADVGELVTAITKNTVADKGADKAA